MAAVVRHLGFVVRVMDHSRRAFGGLYHCAKFGWNWCSSFDNVQVLVLCDFGLKTPIHAPFWGGGLGAHIPQVMSLIILIPKRTVLGRNHVILTMKRAYRLRGSRWALEREKKDSIGQDSKKVTKGLYFTYLGRSPLWSDLHQKLCSRWRPRCDYVCQLSKWNFQGLFYSRSNFSSPYWFLNGPYNSAALLCCLWHTCVLSISTKPVHRMQIHPTVQN